MRTFRHQRRRRGLSLTELLVASTIMVLIVGAMSMLAMTVHSANDYCRGQSLAAQHGRVAQDRIARAVSTATANEQFPGCLVIATTVGSWEFPDTLAVWLPETTASDPAGLPRVGEIVLFTPNPQEPNCLLEIRRPNDSATVPAPTNAAGWRTLANSLRTDATAERITLTDRLRVADAGTNGTNLRGCVRFNRLMTPTEADWTDYRAGSLGWTQIDWPLDAYSSLAGMRRVVCQTELQIAAGDSLRTADIAVPFFGSASLQYDLNR
jgi:hypothetical protein